MSADLPAGWRWATLRSLTSKIGSGATPRGGSAVYVDDGAAFIRSQNVQDHRFAEAGLARISDTAAYALRGVAIERGDVLINITGDSILRCCLAPERALPARVSQHVSIIRPTVEILPLLLQKALCLPSSKSTLLGMSSGGTRKAITKGHLERFVVPVPPLAEQRGIAAILGSLDDKIESNRRCVAAGNALADTLYALLAPTLEYRTLGELRTAGAVTFSDGYRTRSDQLGEPGLPILRVADMDGGLLQPTGDHVKTEYLNGNEAKLSAVSDVVISTKGTVGRVALVSDLDLPVVYSPQVCYIRVRDRAIVLPPLIHRWARSQSFEAQAAGFQRQTDMAPYINLSDFAFLKVPVGGASNPSAGEIEELDRLIAVRQKESLTLIALRDVLVPELLFGRLRVPEARELVEAIV